MPLTVIPFSTEWKSLPVFPAFLLCLGIQVGVYLIVTAGVWLGCGLVRRHWKIGGLLDNRSMKPGQIRSEMRRGSVTCMIYALYFVICLRLSRNVWPSSWGLGAIEVATFLLFYDLCFYLSHRLLHMGSLARIHGSHHQSVRVTPWSVHSLHPVEAAINQLPFLLFMLVWPVGFVMLVLFQVLLMYMTAFGHSNYDPFATGDGLERARSFWRFYQRHHQHGIGNFGFMGLHWDWVFGTTLASTAQACADGATRTDSDPP